MKIDFTKLCGIRSGKIQKIVDDLRSPKRLLGNLFQKFEARVLGADLLTQHLRITGNHSQWGIDFVSHSCSQQAYRRKLVILDQLVFESYAIRNVVDDDQRATCI